MKKLLAIVMVVAMMFSMSVIASADQTAEISYDGSKAVITVYTTAFSTFDVSVVSDATCVAADYDMANFGMSVTLNGSYTYAGVNNAAATDKVGNTYATLTGAGCVKADGSDIPYEGILGTFTYENVEEGTEFKVVTGSASVDDINTATVIATLKAESAPAPTATPVAPTATPVAPTNAPVQPTKAPVQPTKAPVVPTTAPTAPSNGGSANAPQTADVAPIATMISLVVVAGLAIVALKKKATN